MEVSCLKGFWSYQLSGTRAVGAIHNQLVRPVNPQLLIIEGYSPRFPRVAIGYNIRTFETRPINEIYLGT